MAAPGRTHYTFALDFIVMANASSLKCVTVPLGKERVPAPMELDHFYLLRSQASQVTADFCVGTGGVDPIIPSVSSMHSMGTTRDGDQQGDKANKLKGGGFFMHLNRYSVLESTVSSGLNKNCFSLLAVPSWCKCSGVFGWLK